MITLNTKKILIPVDFSETSNSAIVHAATMVKTTEGGELVLLHVANKSDLDNIVVPAAKLKDSSIIKEYLERKMQQIAQETEKKYNVKTGYQVSLGNITSEIVKTANDLEAGMIVMGTQGHEPHQEFFIGSTSYRTLTKSNIPVMTVRDTPNGKGHSRILLPIDSSEHSRQKVNAAIELAYKFSSDLHVIGLHGHDENFEFKLNVILPQIEKLAKTKNVAVTSEIVKASNRAEKTLQHAKKVDADLIIIMTDQRAEFSQLILGTYAHQLINDSRIPVLSIPPEIDEDLMGLKFGGMF